MIDYATVCEKITAAAEELLRTSVIGGATLEQRLDELAARFVEFDNGDDVRRYINVQSDSDLEVLAIFAALGLATLGRRRQELAAMEADHNRPVGGAG